jgi:hypothetical protein
VNEAADGKSMVRSILEALRLKEENKRGCSFAFSSRPAPSSWSAFTFEAPLSFYIVEAPSGNLTQIKSLANGISKDYFVLLASINKHAVLVLRRYKKDDNAPFPVVLRKDEDLERVTSTIRKYDFLSDELTAHSSLISVVDSLKEGAERYFTNRGLFSNHFLKERLSGCLSERGRSLAKEAAGLLAEFGGELPVDPGKAVKILENLSYSVEILAGSGYPEYMLRSHGRQLDLCCVVAGVESLDVKTGEKVAPSYQSVAALRRFGWVVLTNGRIWRLYSGRVSSPSTNYFEVDLDGIVDEADPRLVYFVSLFASSSFALRDNTTDVDLVFEGSISHAQDVENDLKRKVFDEALFLNLIKAVIDFSPAKACEQEELDRAKGLALKLLYRLLFVLYAESRELLPTKNAKYKEYSLELLRPRLTAFEKEPDEQSVWMILKTLFRMISKGDSDANLPQYNGALFEEDSALDGCHAKNKFIVPALHDLMEFEGKGIDYQNLGVRHLGSLYEALLEYSVRQAQQALVVYKEEIMDAKYAEDLKQKPIAFLEKGELYLTAKGLARKGTGSYYTPDEIVNFLVKKGLEPHFKNREEQFRIDFQRLPAASKPRDLELEKKCTEDLLGLKVVDPAMGSGHFLVAVVNEVTKWTIDLLREYPDAPLMREIEEYRKSIIEEQRKRRIRLDEDMLTDDVILKRLIMKRCVYGVDINPLAVELAKVSLWLDSFTIGTPLTFLDHHIRCGDSLIGLWMKNIESKVFDATLDSWTGAISAAGTNLVDEVVMPADLTVEQVTQSRVAYEEIRDKTKPFCVLLDLCCAGMIDPKLGKKLPSNLPLIMQTLKKEQKPAWWSNVEEALRLSREYRFFNWELEFPDAFTRQRKGFDVIVMNPPWDAVKPEDDDFFSLYSPKFRSVRSKPEKKKIMKELLKDKHVSGSYEAYRKAIEDKVRFFKVSEEYRRRGSGDTNCWKLFLERSLDLAAENGSFALVIPSGIVTDEGGKQLREALFECKIRTMYEFENKYGIFPDVHRSYKFVLLVVDKTTPTGSFPAAFYLHQTEALEGKAEQEKFLEIPVGLIRDSAPDSLSIPEPRNKRELDLIIRIYESHPLLGDTQKKEWSIKLIRELDFPADSDLLRTDGKGWPLFDGKNIHQFIPDFEKVWFHINPELGLKRVAKHKEFVSINKQIHEKPRLVLRRITAGTNVRTVIACIIPPNSFSATNAPIVLPILEGKAGSDLKCDRALAYLAGLFNSMVFDFLIRRRMAFTLNFFYIYQTPVPASLNTECAESITKLSARLCSIDNRYKDFARALDTECGPLTIKERIESTAKLNALVAKYYSLNREQLEVILDSFEGFEEDKELMKMKEVKWNDTLIRKFNGEVRKRVLPYFDQLVIEKEEGKSG